MKALEKILFLASALLVCLACNREEETVRYRIGDTARIFLNLFPGDMPAIGVKSEFALDPKVENPIADVWVLQYDELGQLCRSDYSSKTPSLTWQGHLVELDVRPTSTIVVFANLGEKDGDDVYEWPATIGLLRRHQMAEDKSLDISGGANPARLFMVGETILSASDIGSPSTCINIMLSRICCKLAVGVHQSGDEFHDLRIRILNAVNGFTVFPTKDTFTAQSHSDYTEDSAAAITTARKYFYYYLYENMDTDNQTKIEITVTGKDGRERTRIFPITSHGELVRNTYYNVDLELTGSGTYNP